MNKYNIPDKLTVDWLRCCKDCSFEARTEEDLELFRKDPKQPYGRINLCKPCFNRRQRGRDYTDAQRKWYEKNREKVALKGVKYRSENADKIKKYKDDYYEKNKESILIKTMEWQKANPEKTKEIKKKSRTKYADLYAANNIKTNRGIPPELYYERMGRSNVCEICGNEDRLCYDHDHHNDDVMTNFRGVLCNKCNTGIGQLGDTLDSVRKAVKYLERYYNEQKTTNN